MDRSSSRHLTAEISKSAPFAETPWAELVRMCRQICLDHEREPEKRLSSGVLFLRALSDVQTRFGKESIGEDDLEKIVATEANRVADAAVTAELLLPKLVATLRALPLATNSTVNVPSPTPLLSVAAATLPVETGTPPPQRKSARSSPLGVADLIEGMLDQDRNDPRRRSPPPRT